MLRIALLHGMGMPRLAALQLAAFIAVNPAREAMRCVVPTALLLPALQFDLYRIEYFRLDDGRVAALHIVLRHLALIHLHLLGQQIRTEGLLKDGVALYFSFVRMLMMVLGRQLDLPPGDGMPRSDRKRAMNEGDFPSRNMQ